MKKPAPWRRFFQIRDSMSISAFSGPVCHPAAERGIVLIDIQLVMMAMIAGMSANVPADGDAFFAIKRGRKGEGRRNKSRSFRMFLVR